MTETMIQRPTAWGAAPRASGGLREPAWLDRLSAGAWWALLGAALTALLALQLFYWTGSIASDDLSYLRAGLDPFQYGHVAGAQQVFARVMMWLPLRISVELLGNRWQALLPWALFSANLTLLLVGLCAWRWWGRTAALVAVLSLGLVPQYVTVASVALPDTVGAMFGIGGLLLIVPTLVEPNGRPAWRRCLLGGLLIGLGYSAKETSALLYPSLALFVLLWRRRSRKAWYGLFAVAAGALLYLAGETLVLWAITGDPLFHLNSVRAGCRGYGSPVPDNSWRTIAWYTSDYLRWLADPTSAYGAWGLAYLAALAFALWHRTNHRRLLLCCALLGGFYLSAGTVDLRNYFPIYHQPRYLIPLLPVGALLVADMTVSLWRRGGWRRPAVASAAVLLCAGSLLWPDRTAGRMYHASTFHAARLLLENTEPVWTSSSRFVGSHAAAFRLTVLMDKPGRPPIEPLHDSPVTARQWQARYGDAYVWVTKQDREYPRAADGVYLGAPSYAALRTFPCVARQNPPANRMNQLKAWLGLEPRREDPWAAVEVYYVPPAAGPTALLQNPETETRAAGRSSAAGPTPEVARVA